MKFHRMKNSLVPILIANNKEYSFSITTLYDKIFAIVDGYDYIKNDSNGVDERSNCYNTAWDNIYFESEDKAIEWCNEYIAKIIKNQFYSNNTNNKIGDDIFE